MIIPNLNLTRNEIKHHIFNCDSGKIFSKENYNVYEIKNIKIDICNDINVTFEIDNDDYHDLTIYNDTPGKRDKEFYKKLSAPTEFKSIILECDFEEYHVKLINFFGTGIFYGTINSPEVSGKCKYCKLIKNNCEITNNEKIRIWDAYHEDYKISNFFCEKFKNNYLKDKYLISKNRNCECIDNDTDNALDKSFEEICPNNLFLYHESKYIDYLENNDKLIENIDVLLSFFTSNIKHRRMSIIETINKDKLEILFKSKNTHKLNGFSIFTPHPNTFINFLDSSYEKYINLNESNFNIELLIQYYIWFKNEIYIDIKHLLGSIFIETLIKQYYPDESKKFAYKLNNILNQKLNLNIYKLFDKFEIGLLNELEELKSSEMNELDDYERNISIVLNQFKEFLFIEIITKYRNKNVHNGEILLNDNDLEDIFENSFKKTNKRLNGEKNKIIFEILYENKNQIINSEYLKDLNTQDIVLENLMEVILLKLLDINCGLLSNKLRPNIDSKEYIKSLSK